MPDSQLAYVLRSIFSLPASSVCVIPKDLRLLRISVFKLSIFTLFRANIRLLFGSSGVKFLFCALILERYNIPSLNFEVFSLFPCMFILPLFRWLFNPLYY